MYVVCGVAYSFDPDKCLGHQPERHLHFALRGYVRMAKGDRKTRWLTAL